MFFIAEGECSVKRRGGGGGHSNDAERAQPAYDADTVSVLGPLDVFGLEAAPAASSSHHSGLSVHQGHHAHGHHGGHHGHRQRGAEAWVVESLTQVRGRGGVTEGGLEARVYGLCRLRCCLGLCSATGTCTSTWTVGRGQASPLPA